MGLSEIRGEFFEFLRGQSPFGRVTGVIDHEARALPPVAHLVPGEWEPDVLNRAETVSPNLPGVEPGAA